MVLMILMLIFKKGRKIQTDINELILFNEGWEN